MADWIQFYYILITNYLQLKGLTKFLLYRILIDILQTDYKRITNLWQNVKYVYIPTDYLQVIYRIISDYELQTDDKTVEANH